MTINGINGTNGANELKKTTVKADANAKTQAENKKISQELSEELSGATRKNAISENDKKDLIKHYREMGYSRSQAEALFDSKAEKLEKMSRKDAKAWVKDYMEKNVYEFNVTVDPTLNITNVNNANNSKVVNVYNINGQQVNNTDNAGVYILRMADGTTKKVIKK